MSVQGSESPFATAVAAPSRVASLARTLAHSALSRFHGDVIAGCSSLWNEKNFPAVRQTSRKPAALQDRGRPVRHPPDPGDGLQPGGDFLPTVEAVRVLQTPCQRIRDVGPALLPRIAGELTDPGAVARVVAVDLPEPLDDERLALKRRAVLESPRDLERR